MNAQIHKEFGYIIGGVMDKEHTNRVTRVKGEWKMFEYFKAAGAFKIEGKRYTLKRIPFYDSVEMFAGLGAEYEIGGLRFSQDLAPAMLNKRMNFATIERWIELGASHISGLGYAGGERVVASDDIYQTRKARGELR